MSGQAWRAGGLCALMLTAAAASRAQTATTTPAATSHPASKPVHTTPRTGTTKVAATTRQTPHVPVVAPRHAGPPRHAVQAGRHAALAGHHPVPAAHKPAAEVETAAKPAAPPKPNPKPTPALPADVGSNSGLHLPRYASLKTDDVNMRVGPAERYPVIWTYKRRELPVRIEREFDIWRLVEDMDGIKGWVHQATLTGRRTFVITGTQDRILRADASASADAVADLKPGVVGRIRSCDAGRPWCQVQVQDYRGWLQRGDLWGVDADEVVAP